MSSPAEEPKAKVKTPSFDEVKTLVGKSRTDFNAFNKAYHTYTAKFEGPELGKITFQIDKFIKGMKDAYNLYIENFTIMFKIEQENLNAKRAKLATELAELKERYAGQVHSYGKLEAASEERIAGMAEHITTLESELGKLQAAYKQSDKDVLLNADKLAAAADLRADDEGLTFSEGGGTRRRNRQRRGRKSRR